VTLETEDIWNSFSP